MRKRRNNMRDMQFLDLVISSVCKRYAFAEEDILHNSHELVGPRVVDAAWKVHAQHPSLFLLFLLAL